MLSFTSPLMKVVPNEMFFMFKWPCIVISFT